MTDKLGLTWYDWFRLWKGRDKMIAKLGSRKLWATVAGVALTAFSKELGLSEDITAKLVALIVAYILGQGIVDATANRGGGK